MANHKLGTTAKQEIHDALRGLSGAKATAEIARLSNLYGCSKGQIYAISRDVRPPRKRRADCGRRTADIFTDESLRRAAEYVALTNLKPELAIGMAEAQNGVCFPITLATFRRRLRDYGLNRRMRRRVAKAYRPFEAAAPMDIFQFDLSGVKDRWVDVRTRRLYQLTVLDDSRNHPYEHPTRVKLWKASLIDDHSRRRFVRFFAPVNGKPDSTHCIEFLLEAFRVMGICRTLYTDRDQIIIGSRTSRFAQLLNHLYEHDGGFRIEPHKAHSPQSTGKVERTHQVVEEYEPLLGIFEEQMRLIGEHGATLDRLNDFADEMCEKLNWTKHRRTNEVPMLRWNATHQPLRIPPPAVLNAVFTAEEFTVPVAGDVTVSFGGVRYQLPRSAEFPFREMAEAGSKLKIITMKDAPAFFVVDATGTVTEIEKVEARPDTAGEFKSLPTAKRARAVKELRESARAKRELHKAEGTRDLVIGIDVPFKKPARPSTFPQKRQEADLDSLTEAAPAAAAFIEGRPINRWQAITQFQHEGYFADPISDPDKSWLLALFGEREEVLDTEIRAVLDARQLVRKRA